MAERWETGTKLSGAQQSTEVTKRRDVNSSDEREVFMIGTTSSL